MGLKHGFHVMAELFSCCSKLRCAFECVRAVGSAVVFKDQTNQWTTSVCSGKVEPHCTVGNGVFLPPLEFLAFQGGVWKFVRLY